LRRSQATRSRKFSLVDGPAATQSLPFTSRRKNLFPTAEPSDPTTSPNFYDQACSFYPPRNPPIITKSLFSNDLFSSVPPPSLSSSQVSNSVPLQSLVPSSPISVPEALFPP